MVRSMTGYGLVQGWWRKVGAVFILFVLLAEAGAQPSPAASAAFDAYVRRMELRLGRHEPPEAGGAREQLLRGEMVVEDRRPHAEVIAPGAMLHHWRGMAFVAGARAQDFERLMKDFDGYPKYYSPQILRAEMLERAGDRFRVRLRVRQRHVLTVVMDTTYEVAFGRVDGRAGYSVSRSTQVSEIERVGTGSEHSLLLGQEHGYLWRLNSYWSYVERDGGLYMEIESASLTRDIPHGLGWIVAPFVQSIPRESLEFTLRRTGEELREMQQVKYRRGR